jgi:hypothetical protein
MDVGRPCAGVACSFIALAAWVRQLPFWLLNSCAVTECLQKGALEGGKAVHRFDGVMSHTFNCSRLSRDHSELKLSPEIVAGLNQTRRTRQRIDHRTGLAAQFAPALKG